jgi:hypothetical protein
MKQKYKWIYERVKKIITHPAEEWEVVKSEPMHAGWHFHNFVYPFLLAIFITTFIGTFFAIYHDFSFLYIIVKSFSIVLNCFFTLYVSTKLIEAIAIKINVNISIELLYKSLLYSMSAWWTFCMAAGILENYATLSSFLLFLGIIGIYPFWVACGVVLNIAEKDKPKFVAISFLVILIVTKLISWSFGFILQSLKIITAATVINN